MIGKEISKISYPSNNAMPTAPTETNGEGNSNAIIPMLIPLGLVVISGIIAYQYIRKRQKRIERYNGL